MTKRELEILNLIKENPLLSQNEMADMLQITRSSIAVHLSNLVKKGHLKGKGYILNEDPYICVIGGANIDLVGFSSNKINFKDANVGDLKISMGGVGRNIAENLVRLGISTKLICAFGDDLYGRQLIEHSQKIGLDIKDSLIIQGEPSSVHMAIMDNDNQLVLGFSTMDIYDNLTIDFIRKKKEQIRNAKLVVLETNLPEEILEYIVNTFPNQSFLLDTVSGIKSIRAKNVLSKLTILKTNALEAETLTGIKVSRKKDVREAAAFFHAKGVKQVFITLGDQGFYYCNNKKSKMMKLVELKIENVNGAGDAFVAGLAYGFSKGFDIDNMAKIAEACAYKAIEHQETVNPNICESAVLKVIDSDE